jgi:hypothetical protein
MPASATSGHDFFHEYRTEWHVHRAEFVEMQRIMIEATRLKRKDRWWISALSL